MNKHENLEININRRSSVSKFIQILNLYDSNKKFISFKVPGIDRELKYAKIYDDKYGRLIIEILEGGENEQK